MGRGGGWRRGKGDGETAQRRVHSEHEQLSGQSRSEERELLPIRVSVRGLIGARGFLGFCLLEWVSSHPDCK